MKKTLAFTMFLLLLFSFGSCRPAAQSVQNETPPAEATPAPTPLPGVDEGRILLLGEWHSDPACLEKELDIWRACYDAGLRDLFFEMPCYHTEFLNMWLRSDSDELLDQFLLDTGGTAGSSDASTEFLRGIKQYCPETRLHGVDVGHQYETAGKRYVEYLEAEGLSDSEEYRLAQQAIEQGETFYQLERDAKADYTAADVYRESCLAENFIREFDKLGGKSVVGIFGGLHADISAFCCYDGETPNLATQLAARYGDAVKTELLFYLRPVRTESVTVNGKEYQATYYGSCDFSNSYIGHTTLEYWVLEDAYADLSGCEPKADELFYCMYIPFALEPGRIIMIDFHRADGTTPRKFYLSEPIYDYYWPFLQEIAVEPQE